MPKKKKIKKKKKTKIQKTKIQKTKIVEKKTKAVSYTHLTLPTNSGV